MGVGLVVMGVGRKKEVHSFNSKLPSITQMELPSPPGLRVMTPLPLTVVNGKALSAATPQGG
ncbi:hypothetical protein L1049_001222 [Liquidambar formosana]|uniref:Uncharacterized protein n=1 Tax=Liquidambar formosana TaxID=63359 RepID=A0AAP0NA76_LIQFO